MMTFSLIFFFYFVGLGFCENVKRYAFLVGIGEYVNRTLESNTWSNCESCSNEIFTFSSLFDDGLGFDYVEEWTDLTRKQFFDNLDDFKFKRFEKSRNQLENTLTVFFFSGHGFTGKYVQRGDNTIYHKHDFTLVMKPDSEDMKDYIVTISEIHDSFHNSRVGGDVLFIMNACRNIHLEFNRRNVEKEKKDCSREGGYYPKIFYLSLDGGRLVNRMNSDGLSTTTSHLLDSFISLTTKNNVEFYEISSMTISELGRDFDFDETLNNYQYNLCGNNRDVILWNDVGDVNFCWFDNVKRKILNSNVNRNPHERIMNDLRSECYEQDDEDLPHTPGYDDESDYGYLKRGVAFLLERYINHIRLGRDDYKMFIPQLLCEKKKSSNDIFEKVYSYHCSNPVNAFEKLLKKVIEVGSEATDLILVEGESGSGKSYLSEVLFTYLSKSFIEYNHRRIFDVFRNNASYLKLVDHTREFEKYNKPVDPILRELRYFNFFPVHIRFYSIPGTFRKNNTVHLYNYFYSETFAKLMKFPDLLFPLKGLMNELGVSGGIVLILDGFDEVGEEILDLEQIFDVFKDREVRVVIFSRGGRWKTFGSIIPKPQITYTIQKNSPDIINETIIRFVEVESEYDPDRVKEPQWYWDLIHSSSEIKEFCENQMMLRILLDMTIEEEENLRSMSRYKLYEKYAKNMIAKKYREFRNDLDRHCHDQENGIQRIPFSDEEFNSIVFNYQKVLALNILKKGHGKLENILSDNDFHNFRFKDMLPINPKLGEDRKEQLRRVHSSNVDSFYARGYGVDDIFLFLKCSFIKQLDNQEPNEFYSGNFSFSHQTFLEFFAAVGISEQSILLADFSKKLDDGDNSFETNREIREDENILFSPRLGRKSGHNVERFVALRINEDSDVKMSFVRLFDFGEYRVPSLNSLNFYYSNFRSSSFLLLTKFGFFFSFFSVFYFAAFMIFFCCYISCHQCCTCILCKAIISFYFKWFHSIVAFIFKEFYEYVLFSIWRCCKWSFQLLYRYAIKWVFQNVILNVFEFVTEKLFVIIHPFRLIFNFFKPIFCFIGRILLECWKIFFKIITKLCKISFKIIIKLKKVIVPVCKFVRIILTSIIKLMEISGEESGVILNYLFFSVGISIHFVVFVFGVSLVYMELSDFFWDVIINEPLDSFSSILYWMRKHTILFCCVSSVLFPLGMNYFSLIWEFELSNILFQQQFLEKTYRFIIGENSVSEDGEENEEEGTESTTENTHIITTPTGEEIVENQDSTQTTTNGKQGLFQNSKFCWTIYIILMVYTRLLSFFSLLEPIVFCLSLYYTFEKQSILFLFLLISSLGARFITGIFLFGTKIFDPSPFDFFVSNVFRMIPKLVFISKVREIIILSRREMKKNWNSLFTTLDSSNSDEDVETEGEKEPSKLLQEAFKKAVKNGIPLSFFFVGNALRSVNELVMKYLHLRFLLGFDDRLIEIFGCWKCFLYFTLFSHLNVILNETIYFLLSLYVHWFFNWEINSTEGNDKDLFDIALFEMNEHGVLKSLPILVKKVEDYEIEKERERKMAEFLDLLARMRKQSED